jgi:hypothetical protein
MPEVLPQPTLKAGRHLSVTDTGDEVHAIEGTGVAHGKCEVAGQAHTRMRISL